MTTQTGTELTAVLDELAAELADHLTSATPFDVEIAIESIEAAGEEQLGQWAWQGANLHRRLHGWRPAKAREQQQAALARIRETVHAADMVVALRWTIGITEPGGPGHRALTSLPRGFALPMGEATRIEHSLAMYDPADRRLRHEPISGFLLRHLAAGATGERAAGEVQ